MLKIGSDEAPEGNWAAVTCCCVVGLIFLVWTVHFSHHPDESCLHVWGLTLMVVKQQVFFSSARTIVKFLAAFQSSPFVREGNAVIYFSNSYYSVIDASRWLKLSERKPLCCEKGYLYLTT